MINFLYQKNEPYTKVLDSLIKPIITHLPKGTFVINPEPVRRHLNIIFFTSVFAPNGVFISHGIADKNYRNADITNKYKYVCVSGPTWKEKLIKQGMSPKKIFIAGYTKLDPIFQGKLQKNICDKKVVLWAPTYGDWKHGSIETFGSTISDLGKDFVFYKSPHPAQADNNEPTLQKLLDADIVISDSGSLVYEAWALGKPVIFPDWLIKQGVLRYLPGSFEEYIYENNLGYHVDSFDELAATLRKDLIVDSKVTDFMEGIFPKSLRGNSGKITAETLLYLDNLT